MEQLAPLSMRILFHRHDVKAFKRYYGEAWICGPSAPWNKNDNPSLQRKGMP